jgi:carbon-monoxide dehydrogenase large subunit
MTMKFGFGQPLTRKEDDPLLRGAGRYIADVSPAKPLHAVVIRSPHAHARFRIGDLARVRAMPGVRLVLTAADISTLGLATAPGVLPDVAITIPDYPVPAKMSCHASAMLWFVVADTLDAAKDAAEAVEIEWQMRVTGAVAASAGRPSLGG